MRQAEEKQIDGHMWTVTPFSATEGLRIMVALGKLLGGPIGKAVSALQGGKEGLLDMDVGDVSFKMIGEAIGELTQRLDEASFEQMVKRLVQNTRVDGQEVGKQFNLVFAGAYATLFKVIAVVIEVNYQLPLGDLLQQQVAERGFVLLKPSTPEST